MIFSLSLLACGLLDKMLEQSDDQSASSNDFQERELNWKAAKSRHEERKRKSTVELSQIAEGSFDEDDELMNPFSSAAGSQAQPLLMVDTSVVASPRAASSKKTTASSKKGKKKKDSAPKRVSPPIVEPQCARTYTKDNCKTSLFRVCLGIKSSDGGDRLLGDIDVEPYTLMWSHKTWKQQSKCKSTNDDLRSEVKRRSHVFGLESPTTKWKSYGQLKEWLVANPSTNTVDIEYLREQELVMYKALKNFIAQKASGQEKEKEPQWCTDIPHRCLMHCAANDSAKAALVILLRAKDHQELDGRHSPHRPMVYYELVAKLFNDRLLVFWSLALGDLHGDFVESVRLAF